MTERPKSTWTRTALVTGSASGIGRAIAAAFAARGTSVVLVDRDPAVHETAATLGPRCRGFEADIASEESIHAIYGSTSKSVGPIDILIKNAAIVRLAPASRSTRSRPRWSTPPCRSRYGLDRKKISSSSMIASRRLATTDDVASAVTYLASEEAGTTNGRNLAVEGGLSIIF